MAEDEIGGRPRSPSAESQPEVSGAAKVADHEDASSTRSKDHGTAPDEDQQGGEQKDDSGDSREWSPATSATSSRETGEAYERSSDELEREQDDRPLPNEPLLVTADVHTQGTTETKPQDDGWEYHWNVNTNSFWFYNKYTHIWQEENPRVPAASSSSTIITDTATITTTANPTLLPSVSSAPGSIANGYNPAIHGDYDPNAWYAQSARAAEEAAATAAREQHAAQAALLVSGATEDETAYATSAAFNRRTGQWQSADQGPERHSDEAKIRRQLNAYFDVDAAANMHDGRSLKAERAGKKPSKAELKAFKEKRRAKKEEKRRAWLRD